jgi:hypothetical protein
MTSMNILPGVHHISITSSKEKEKSPIIQFESKGDTEIAIAFTLTGLKKLINPVTLNKMPFYIYIFLVYQNGGKNFEVISSTQFHCNKNHLNHDSLYFHTTLDIPKDKCFPDLDFVWNYYSIEIVYSETEAQDASDINYMFNNPGNSLFRAKLNISNEGE